VLTSAGIDIGSSTSHVVLSRLTIRRRGSDLSTEFVVSEREVLYVSEPLLTPYTDGTRIDVGAVEEFVHTCYDAADVRPDDVDTGAVVITGEALNKDNAPQVADMLSRWSGDFICVSAGPSHEAMLAAHGSGSVALSERENCVVLNVDIGGGTTKLAVVVNGVISQVAAFSVAARLVAFDVMGTVTRIEPPARTLAAEAGVDLELGRPISARDIDRLATLMADVVLAAITGSASGLLLRLTVTPSGIDRARLPRPIDRIVFSGGVSEYIDGRDSASYGDLGPALGGHIRDRLTAAGLSTSVEPADQGIRATVLGASQFTVQASGQTCYVPDEQLLPIRSLPVVRVEMAPAVDPRSALQTALKVRDLDDLREPVAIAVGFHGPRDYAGLRRSAAALVDVAAGGPLVVVLKDDLARAFGRIIDAELHHAGPLVVIDGIEVGDLDYLDIGRPMGSTRSFPVTVKSLTLALRPAPELAVQGSHAHEH
jgi:ethanolamine utilization protein EutA